PAFVAVVGLDHVGRRSLLLRLGGAGPVGGQQVRRVEGLCAIGDVLLRGRRVLRTAERLDRVVELGPVLDREPARRHRLARGGRVLALAGGELPLLELGGDRLDQRVEVGLDGLARGLRAAGVVGVLAVGLAVPSSSSSSRLWTPSPSGSEPPWPPSSDWKGLAFRPPNLPAFFRFASVSGSAASGSSWLATTEGAVSWSTRAAVIGSTRPSEVLSSICGPGATGTASTAFSTSSPSTNSGLSTRSSEPVALFSAAMRNSADGSEGRSTALTSITSPRQTFPLGASVALARP